MDFKTQAAIFLTNAQTRRRSPVRPSTLKTYKSLLTHLLAYFGDTDLSQIDNQSAKGFFDSMKGYKDASTASFFNLLKQVMESAKDAKGTQLYPRVWDKEFIDLPVVNPRAQKAPIATVEAIEKALQATNGEVRGLIAVLAGTGLRINEALNLTTGTDDGVSNYYDPTKALINVRVSKTDAGIREVDLCEPLNAFLQANLASPKPFTKSNVHYYLKLKDLGIPGHHSLRRRRMTYLKSKNVPDTLIKFWIGHETTSDISERYTKVGAEVEFRKSVANDLGLGFQL